MSTPSIAEIVTRLDRLPVTRWHTQMRIVLGLCTMFDAYDALAIAFVVPALVGPWHLAASDIGLLISAGFAGQVVGAAGFGMIGERYGRIFALSIAIVIVSVFGLACAGAWDPTSMVIFRFLQGIGLGGQIPVAASYVNEMAPTKGRGRFTLLYQLVYPLGLAAAGAISVWLLPRVGWQWMFIIGATPILALPMIRLTIPESPRWLARHGKLQQAASALTKLESYAPGRISEAPAAGWSQSAPVPTGALRFAQTSDLFQERYQQRTVKLWVVWFAALSIGYGLLSWMPSLYSMIYHLSLQDSLFYTSATQLFGLGCVTISSLLVDKIGRKKMISGAFLAGSLALTVLAAIGQPSPMQLMAFGALAMGSIGIVQISLWTYTPELYPTHMRSLGTGAASTLGRLGSMGAPWMIGLLLGKGFPISTIFWIYASFAIAGLVMMTVFGVETAQRLLEEVSPDTVASEGVSPEAPSAQVRSTMELRQAR
jgi:MFS transporter, putative metabolite:H+ symporter